MTVVRLCRYLGSCSTSLARQEAVYLSFVYLEARANYSEYEIFKLIKWKNEAKSKNTQGRQEIRVISREKWWG